MAARAHQALPDDVVAVPKVPARIQHVGEAAVEHSEHLRSSAVGSRLC